MAGARISRRALEAKAAGLLTTTEMVRHLARRFGISQAAIRECLAVIEPNEWHHSGWDWKATDFYGADRYPDVAAFTEAVAAGVAELECVTGGERRITALAGMVKQTVDAQEGRFCGRGRADRNGLTHSYRATDGDAVWSPDYSF